MNITNSIGMIVLYQNGSFVSGPGGLGMFSMGCNRMVSNLITTDDPLASNFSIRSGKEPVTIPNVKPGAYQIVCE